MTQTSDERNAELRTHTAVQNFAE